MFLDDRITLDLSFDGDSFDCLVPYYAVIDWKRNLTDDQIDGYRGGVIYEGVSPVIVSYTTLFVYFVVAIFEALGYLWNPIAVALYAVLCFLGFIIVLTSFYVHNFNRESLAGKNAFFILICRHTWD